MNWVTFGLGFTAGLGVVAAAGTVIGATRQRRTGGQQAPGDGHTPVPGGATPPRREPPGPAAQPRAAVPGTGPHPEHGIRLLSADFYEDGTVLVHDHLRRNTTRFEAPEPSGDLDWDDWLKGMTP